LSISASCVGIFTHHILQCFDAVGWVTGRVSVRHTESFTTTILESLLLVTGLTWNNS